MFLLDLINQDHIFYYRKFASKETKICYRYYVMFLKGLHAKFEVGSDISLLFLLENYILIE